MWALIVDEYIPLRSVRLARLAALRWLRKYSIRAERRTACEVASAGRFLLRNAPLYQDTRKVQDFAFR